MKIALINPPVESRYVHSIDEPLGILYLAAHLRDKHDLLIIDSFSHNLTVEETLDICLDFDVDIVGISTVFSTSYKTSKEICEKVKYERPSTITILGGNTATFMAEELVKLPFIDYVVRGESDISFPILVDVLSGGGDVSQLKGITYKRDNQVLNNENQPLVKDLDSLPFPARDLLPNSGQYPKSILSTRGCAYGCIYCSTSAFWGKGFRMRSVDNIIEEIEALVSEGNLTYFSFADDCFTLVPQRAIEICTRIGEMGFDLEWSCTGRIETISDQLLKSLRGAGCKSIFFGIESGSERILKELNRKYTRNEVIRVYNLCIENGIKPYFSFIVGLPYETIEDVEETYNLINMLRGVENGIHILTPFPGTPMVENSAKYGLDILPHSIEELDLNTRSFIKTSELNPEEIESLFRKAIGYSFKSLKREAKEVSYE
ncbi:B12-binding domain-containing radical SAM protein [Tissierella creatinini]|nr:B12-binding domain-containing radical SAM protein [Tissierella creatinini]TJX60375.1 B12-binding domain-containing radical SAM protein [Soehngenia saccharolytica]